MKLKSILASIFGGMKATEATENMTATANVASINPLEALENALEKVEATNKKATEELEALLKTTETTESTPHTATMEEKVEAMTTEKAVETLEAQMVEKSTKILSRCTTSEKTKKELVKVEAKEKEAEKEALEAEASTTATEKSKACKRFTADFWHNLAEKMNDLYLGQLYQEAEKKARLEAMKKKATETLEAVASGKVSLEEAVKNMTTEELETMKAVAKENKEEAKKEALEATNKMTTATMTEKEATLFVYGRHEQEGTANESEVAFLRVNEVEKEKKAIMNEVVKKVAETKKKVAEKVKAQTSKEYTFSKSLGKMKEEAETWQGIYDEAKVEVQVATMTPATLSAWCHVFLQVPTGEGLKIGTGRGVKAVDKWTLDALHDYIVTNNELHKAQIDTATMEAHTATLEKAEKALEAVKALEAKKEAMKEEKKKAEEKVEKAETVKELEKALEEVKMVEKNVETLEAVKKEAKEEATEALEAVKEEKVETLEEVKKARTTAKTGGRGKKSTTATTGGRGKKSTTTKEKAKEEAVEKSTTETMEKKAS